MADNRTTALAGVAKIEALNAACGIPNSLKAMGVDEDSIPQMAKEAMKIQRLLKNNPREITEQDAIEIFKAAM